MVIFIYALIDPRTGFPVYVGKTNNPKIRLKSHRSGRGNTRCAAFIRELRGLKIRIEMKILEETDDLNWEERERYWIRHVFSSHNLLNASDGGQPGKFGSRSQITRDRIREISLGREISEEARKQISASLTGLKQSAETVNKRMNTININRVLKGLNPLTIYATQEDYDEAKRQRSRDSRRARRRALGQPERGSSEWKQLISERTKTAMDNLPSEKRERLSHPRRAWNRGKKLPPFTEERRKLQSEKLKAYIATLMPEQKEARMAAAREARRIQDGR